MTKIHGNLTGLSVLEQQGLERLDHHTCLPQEVVSEALATRMCGLAAKLKRQVGVLIDRNGRVTHVLAGDDHQLVLPDLGRWGKDSGRLRGLRLVHVHLKGEPVSGDDLNDLARLGLDLVVALTHRDGLPQLISVAHLASDRRASGTQTVEPTEVMPQVPWSDFSMDCAAFVAEVEARLSKARPAGRLVDARARAVLVHVGPENHAAAEDRLDELEELARTAHVEVVGRVIQRTREVGGRTLLGSGKLNEITLKAMQADATALIFGRELSPSQSKAIAQHAELKVLDRTQLILDIFARRARSQDGKLQVELAQLRYSLPRLGDRDNALSRLAGGIGGVGPGETKLEIDRRRCRDRIHRLEDQLEKLKRGREVRRSGRTEGDVLSMALIGYTNVGKSSILNALSKSDAYTENLLFATLDPTTRRIRLPGGTPVVITDTVGFIRDLPKQLLGAFEATLEEADAADLLLLVVDAAHPQMEQQLNSVVRILGDHSLGDHPRRFLLNKCDAIHDPAAVRDVATRYDAAQVSAVSREGLADLLVSLEDSILSARRSWLERAERDRLEAGAQTWSPID